MAVSFLDLAGAGDLVQSHSTRMAVSFLDLAGAGDLVQSHSTRMGRGLLPGAGMLAGTVGRVMWFKATRRARGLLSWDNCRAGGSGSQPFDAHGPGLLPGAYGLAGTGWPCREFRAIRRAWGVASFLVRAGWPGLLAVSLVQSHSTRMGLTSLGFVWFAAVVPVRLRATRRAWRPPLSSSESSVMNTRLVVVSYKLILVTLTSWLGSCHHAALVHWSLLQTDWPPSALPGECS